MAEPSPDDIDLDACFEEVYGGAMAEGVWVQTVVLLPQCAAFQRGGVPLNDFVDSESCERLPLLRKEHRRCLLGRIGCHQLRQQCHSFRPQRTTAPFVSFPVEADSVGFIEVDIHVSKISGFLNARAGIVEEHQQRAVSQC